MISISCPSQQLSHLATPTSHSNTSIPPRLTRQSISRITSQSSSTTWRHLSRSNGGSWGMLISHWRQGRPCWTRNPSESSCHRHHLTKTLTLSRSGIFLYSLYSAVIPFGFIWFKFFVGHIIVQGLCGLLLGWGHWVSGNRHNWHTCGKSQDCGCYNTKEQHSSVNCTGRCTVHGGRTGLGGEQSVGDVVVWDQAPHPYIRPASRVWRIDKQGYVQFIWKCDESFVICIIHDMLTKHWPWQSSSRQFSWLLRLLSKQWLSVLNTPSWEEGVQVQWITWPSTSFCASWLRYESMSLVQMHKASHNVHFRSCLNCST